MGKGRILYVNQEIIPFTAETPNAVMCRHLAAYSQDHNREIRVFMPRFNHISERKHQLHEVIRLSGMNIVVNNCDRQLIIKVGSIPSGRMQVYFIDNEEYFSKHGGFLDENGKLFEDNDERLLFFGKGTLEAVRKLAWQPHVVHFTGWFSSMIPFYLRRINKENNFFNNTKTIISLINDPFPGKLSDAINTKMKSDKATAKDLATFQNLDYKTLMKATISYSNAVIIADPNVDPELVAFAKENKKNVLDYNPNEQEFFEQINKFYDSIIGKIE